MPGFPTPRSLLRLIGAPALVGLLAATLAAPASARPRGPEIAEQNISNTRDQSEAPEIAIGAGRLAAVWGERFNYRLGFGSTWLGAGWPGATFLDTGTRSSFQWPDVAVDGLAPRTWRLRQATQCSTRARPPRASGSARCRSA